jgi:transcriptional regulator with XRE-family HTH domain
MVDMLPDILSHRIQSLRQRSGLSIRQLAAKAGVSAAMVSYVERGQTAISLVTLQKILAALGTDLGTFFAEGESNQTGPVYQRERMKTVQDSCRGYTLLFPRRADIALEMFDEVLKPGRKPQFEVLKCDVAAYVISGTLRLEVAGQESRDLRPGDAFYLAQGKKHRGYPVGKEPVRLISACYPAKY